MALFGKVEDLLPLVHPGSRLHRGLALLKDYLDGRSVELDQIVRRQQAGDKARIDLDGDLLYLIIQCRAPKPPAEWRFEAHQRHTDVQFLCAGVERIDVCDLRRQTGPPAYDASGNMYFPLGDAPHTRLRLERGDCAVFFPNEAHAPCLPVAGAPDELLRKIVVKIKDAHLI
jgi:biofilm protein TabA